LTFVPVIYHVTLKLAVSRSQPPVPYVANLFIPVLHIRLLCFNKNLLTYLLIFVTV